MKKPTTQKGDAGTVTAATAGLSIKNLGKLLLAGHKIVVCEERYVRTITPRTAD